MEYSNQSGFKMWWQRMPVVVRNIILINILIFLFTWLEQIFNERVYVLILQYGALFPWGSGFFMPHQLVTHMFMHGGFFHVMFNMYALFFFGCVLENVWGRKKFLFYYFVTGIGAALCHLAVMYWMGETHPIPTVGASGAVYGILLGYGMLFPDNKITMIFPIPMTLKAKWFVLVFGIIELLFGFLSIDNTAHWAHLGGMLFGILLILRWKDKNRMYTEY